MRPFPRALPVRSAESGNLLGWYPDRGVYQVGLHLAAGGTAMLLTKRADELAWLASDLALPLLVRLADYVPREECYAMPEGAL